MEYTTQSINKIDDKKIIKLQRVVDSCNSDYERFLIADFTENITYKSSVVRSCKKFAVINLSVLSLMIVNITGVKYGEVPFFKVSVLADEIGGLLESFGYNVSVEL